MLLFSGSSERSVADALVLVLLEQMGIFPFEWGRVYRDESAETDYKGIAAVGATPVCSLCLDFPGAPVLGSGHR